MYKLEIAAGSVDSCIRAEKGGADRIELCDNLLEGGTTPSYATIVLAKKYVKIPVYPIIRPRGGDFLYTDIEFENMALDIEMCKKSGCDGVVIGILTAEGKIDKVRSKKLVEIASPMKVTFHRAFDMTVDPFEALEDVIGIGCERILTSGRKNSAPEGMELLAELVLKAGNRIIIMPGGGVREKNISELAAKTGAKEFHTSAKIYIESEMIFRNPNLSMGNIPTVPEYGIATVSEDQVRKMKELINS